MRLAAFKAHGFKSFADSVAFKVGGELTGVVGPNGCGKSNIVDAVRWVLGESRASSLRGSTLSDVMFNGSERRSPADWCEVELRFENPAAGKSRAENPAAGMWAAYPEIIVRRELARDGRQAYTINGNTVRRRDVVDLFRGTGVAPRAYGVVEQGMVTDIAEASPEELRVFMEEAAGVSHYKERRRDSERRLEASNENLAQLAQLLDGMQKRVESLKRQARTARRYRELGEEINRLDALLLLSKRAGAEEALAASRARLAEWDEKINTLQAELTALKKDSDDKKAAHGDLQTELDSALARLSEAQNAHTAAEHRLQNAAQGKNVAHARQQEAQQELATLAEQAAQLKARQTELEKQRAAAAAAIAQSAGAADAEASELARLQIGRESMQTSVDAARDTMTQAQQQLEAANLRGQLLQEQTADLDKRLLAEREAQNALPPADDSPESETPPADALVAAAQTALDAARAALAEHTAAAAAADDRVRALENDIATLTAQVDTLNAMLREDGWPDGGQRLAQVLQVDAGAWSRALDAALGLYAGAHTVDDIAAYLADGQLPPAGAAVVEIQPAAAAAAANDTGLPTLMEKINAPDSRRQALDYWLGDVFAADDDAQAIAARARLSRHQRIVTRAGAVHGAHSLLISGEARGGYDWEQRMRDLLAQQQQQTAALEEQRTALNTARAAGEQQQQEVAKLEQELTQAQQTLAEQRIELNRRLERQRVQQARREELAQTIAALEDDLRQRREAQTANAADTARLQEQHAAHAAEFDRQKSALDNASAALESYRELVQDASMKRRDMERQAQELARQQEDTAARLRDNEERQQLITRRAQEFEREARHHDEAALQQTLAECRQAVAACEKDVATRRAARQAAEQEATQRERRREQTQSDLEKQRQRQSDERLTERELALKVNYLNDSLDELELPAEQLETLKTESDGEADTWQATIDALRGKRERLGAINFMADSELRDCEAQASELVAQKTDIETAIEELRAAIRRIDAETKTRLQQMFDAVNQEFSVLYKRIFDGGEARLDMTGEAILDSGFELKVRPPGKRLFPVRMLSGGEKAASAAAFLFSILRLNPPPFCILDEVDAPLDDNRSQRFISLLQDISKTVQCLVVTHNKSTISSMPRLIGVTQEEAGISKIVSVTLNDALRSVSA